MSPKPALSHLPFFFPFLFILFALGVTTWCGCATVPSSYARMIERAQDSVVRISDNDTLVCTGEVVAPELGPDRILTAAHCVADAGPFYADGVLAHVIKTDPHTDLALLYAPVHRPALWLRTDPAVRFEELTGIGYAFGGHKLYDLQVRVLLVDSVPEETISPGLIVQSSYIPGMSGGPVIDADGQMVGIIQQANSGIGYGVGTLLIRGFLLGIDPE